MSLKSFEEGLLALLVALSMTLVLQSSPVQAGSCRAAKLCCQGRDSGCVIQKASPNAIIETPRDKPCYCDHACLKLADCCDDFNETCTVSDCTTSEWSNWSECDNRCGSGTRSRHRTILRPERNGGKPCPETEETEACQDYDACRRRARHFLVEETSFAPTRSYEATLDSNFVPGVADGYCAAFTLLKVSRGCRRRLESFYEGSRICVWCRNDSDSSCRRDVLLAGIGRWELTSRDRAPTRCHGKWLAEDESTSRTTTSGDCRTDCRPRLAFV